MTKVERGLDYDPAVDRETARCIVENNQGRILLLQKSPESNAPDMYEFPGGKIDIEIGRFAMMEDQIQAVVKEVNEEAGLDISEFSPEKKDEFSYEFQFGESNFRSRVHVFYVQIPSDGSDVIVDQTKNELGLSEDKHQGFAWFTKDELLSLKAENKLLGNSRQFEKALELRK